MRAQQVIREDHSLDEVIETEDDGGASNFVSVISTAVKQAKSSKKRWNKAQHALRDRKRLPPSPSACVRRGLAAENRLLRRSHRRACLARTRRRRQRIF